MKGGAASKVAGTPFAKPEPKPAPAAAAAAAAAAADPFAASAQRVVVQQIKIADDGREVTAQEVGKARRWVLFVLIFVGLLAGLALGFVASKVNNQNVLWNSGVGSAKSVYQRVRDASNTLSKTQTYITALAEAARGRPGQAPTIDYQAIDSLAGLENPFPASTFTEADYTRFDGSTVADLFEYYQNIQKIWDRVQVLQARTNGDQVRERLNRAAAAEGILRNPIGCAPLETQRDDQFRCSLMFMMPKEGEEGVFLAGRAIDTPPDQRAERRAITNLEEQASDIRESPNNFFMGIDYPTSRGVLSQQTNEFQEIVRLVAEIKGIMEATTEVQGRLEQSLGRLVSLEERVAI
jgi:hypothetical protein